MRLGLGHTLAVGLLVVGAACLGEYVVDGASACGDDDLALCGDRCVDVQSDANHCGECGNACSDDYACQFGNCTQSCEDGLALCDQACVDIEEDPQNCGGCDQACDSDEDCHDGACTDECDEACDSRREVCVDESCVCRGGLVRCAEACVDIDNDPTNCGGCGIDCAGMPCGDGACRADCSGFSDQCDSTCTNTASDPLNCGQCGHACDNDELCADGDCRDYAPASCGSCPCEADCDEAMCCFSDFVEAAVCVSAAACP